MGQSGGWEVRHMVGRLGSVPGVSEERASLGRGCGVSVRTEG